MASNARPTRRSAATTVLAVLIVLLAGAVLRWRFLDHPMRYDESYNYIHYASRSPGHILTHYTPNNHVLHTLMVQAASRMWGDSPAALRIPAFVGGVLLIAAAAWLAWIVSSSRLAALLTAIAVAGSSPLVEYSANARGYSWLALFATLLTGLTVKLLRNPHEQRSWVLWTVVGASGAFTVPVMGLAIVGNLVGLIAGLWKELRGAVLRNLTVSTGLCFVLSLLFYLPILLSEGPQKLLATRDMAYGILGDQIRSWSDMVTAASLLAVRHAPAWCVAAYVFGFVVFAVAALVRPDRHRSLPLVLLATAPAMAWLARAPLPARAWLFALPMFLTCSAVGIACVLSAIRAAPLRVAVGTTLLALSVVGSLPVVRESRLCAEPCGLVEVEDALRECHQFGAERCAVVSRFSPATAYYTRRLGIARMAPPDQAERIYIVADDGSAAAELWNPSVPGFDRFSPLRPWPSDAPAGLYVADLAQPSALANN